MKYVYQIVHEILEFILSIITLVFTFLFETWIGWCIVLAVILFFVNKYKIAF